MQWNHPAPLIRKEFSDSHISKQFTCGRTKTAAIVNCIGDYFSENLKGNMQNLRFSPMLDNSNDLGYKKMFSVTVHVYETFNPVKS